ncbi:MAG: PadR family transcriptional regulator [Acidimicrobiales bacterium]
MLDMAILGLLEERDELHGYEIRKQLRDGLGLLANVSFGSLYPALARLEAASAVEATDPVAPTPPRGGPDVPLTGSLSGEWAVLRSRHHTGGRPRGRRSRKAYRITEEGRRLFADLLCRADAGDDSRSFGLRLAFADHLPPHARLALLERRRAQLADRLAEVRAAPGPGLGAYARTVVEHTSDGVAHDIRWLDRLIDAERATGAQPSPPPARRAKLTGELAAVTAPEVTAATAAPPQSAGAATKRQGANR